MPYIRHLDWLGSARLSTTWSHTVQSKVAYAPFGETYNEAGAASNDRSFTGQEQDTVSGNAATGIYDFLFRKYDPAAGRWLSPDPSGWVASATADPQSFDRYSYVENQPMRAVDPNGLACIYVDASGAVSVSNFNGDAMMSNACTSNGGTYEDGYVDPDSVQNVLFTSSGNYVGFNYTDSSGNTNLVNSAVVYSGVINPDILQFEANMQSDVTYNGGQFYSPASYGVTFGPPPPVDPHKKCLDDFNNSPDGKFYNFMSLASPLIGPDPLGSLGEDTIGPGSKYVALKFFDALGYDSLVEGTKNLVREVVLPVSIAATAAQIAGHVGCAL